MGAAESWEQNRLVPHSGCAILELSPCPHLITAPPPPRLVFLPRDREAKQALGRQWWEGGPGEASARNAAGDAALCPCPPPPTTGTALCEAVRGMSKPRRQEVSLHGVNGVGRGTVARTTFCARRRSQGQSQDLG
ncbi:UNVERIFIED_CONTAM: hypothetical protein K2H54_047037 [Gekko kuhli]